MAVLVTSNLVHIAYTPTTPIRVTGLAVEVVRSLAASSSFPGGRRPVVVIMS